MRSKLLTLLGGALAVIALTGCKAATTPAATPKEHVFRGKVEVVDAASRRLTVLNEDIEGWMGPMTMAYNLKPDEVIATIKAGDTITATVRDGDFSTLYGVAVAQH